MSLPFPGDIQVQLIDDDDPNTTFGPLEQTSLSTNNSAGTSGFRGLKRRLSHGAHTDAENERTEPTSSQYFTRPSIDSLKSFFDFHPHQPRADTAFNTELAYFRVDPNGEKVHHQFTPSSVHHHHWYTVQFALLSEKVLTPCSLATLMTRNISIQGLKNTKNARLTLLMSRPS